jgi:hypothetical protein
MEGFQEVENLRIWEFLEKGIAAAPFISNATVRLNWRTLHSTGALLMNATNICASFHSCGSYNAKNKTKGLAHFDQR